MFLCVLTQSHIVSNDDGGHMMSNISKIVTYDTVLLERECKKYQDWLDRETEEVTNWLQRQKIKA